MSLLFFLPNWKSILRSTYSTAGFNTVTKTIATFCGIFSDRVLFFTLFRRSCRQLNKIVRETIEQWGTNKKLQKPISFYSCSLWTGSLFGEKIARKGKGNGGWGEPFRFSLSLVPRSTKGLFKDKFKDYSCLTFPILHGESRHQGIVCSDSRVMVNGSIMSEEQFLRIFQFLALGTPSFSHSNVVEIHIYSSFWV